MKSFLKLTSKLFGDKSVEDDGGSDEPSLIDLPTALRPYFPSSKFRPIKLEQEQHYPKLKMAHVSADNTPGQVVFREDTMLDMDLLTRYSGKNFHRMPQSQYRRMLTKVGLNMTPPIPELTGNDTWVDIRVDELDYALVDVTGFREYMVIDRERIQHWLEDIPREPLTMEVQQFDPHSGIIANDVDKINSAIRKMTRLRIEKRLKDTLDLPPLPSVARKIIELRANPNANAFELVAVVESDPTLAANVMRWANSSMYSMSGDVRSIHDAINRVLGFDLVMNLSMGLALGKIMEIPKHETTHILNHWEQAIWVAHATTALADLIGPDFKACKGLAYLCGLLHNFGYLVLSHTFPPHFKIITESTDINRHVDVSLIDAHILGVTREQVATELMENWRLPKEVVYGIRYQKQLLYDDEHRVYANLVYLARSKLIQYGVALGAPMAQPGYLIEQLELEESAVDSRIVELLKQEDRILSMARMM